MDKKKASKSTEESIYSHAREDSHNVPGAATPVSWKGVNTTLLYHCEKHSCRGVVLYQ